MLETVSITIIMKLIINLISWYSCST